MRTIGEPAGGCLVAGLVVEGAEHPHALPDGDDVLGDDHLDATEHRLHRPGGRPATGHPPEHRRIRAGAGRWLGLPSVRMRNGQVGDDRRQLAVFLGCAERFEPLLQLGEAQPAVARCCSEYLGDAVAVGVGGALRPVVAGLHDA